MYVFGIFENKNKQMNVDGKISDQLKSKSAPIKTNLNCQWLVMHEIISLT